MQSDNVDGKRLKYEKRKVSLVRCYTDNRNDIV